jgi:hypothetical protein
MTILWVYSIEWKREGYQEKLWNGVHQEEENEVDLNSPGRKGLDDWWVKMDWWRKTQLEEEHNIINKWAQKYVNTLYRLLNNNIIV